MEPWLWEKEVGDGRDAWSVAGRTVVTPPTWRHFYNDNGRILWENHIDLDTLDHSASNIRRKLQDQLIKIQLGRRTAHDVDVQKCIDDARWSHAATIASVVHRNHGSVHEPASPESIGIASDMLPWDRGGSPLHSYGIHETLPRIADDAQEEALPPAVHQPSAASTPPRPVVLHGRTTINIYTR
eukprot:Sspe_Gene.77495::Locus_48428_Transcript_1_1_Confidence_1.000_Length_666::g.77495::m.77495